MKAQKSHHPISNSKPRGSHLRAYLGTLEYSSQRQRDLYYMYMFLPYVLGNHYVHAMEH